MILILFQFLCYLLHNALTGDRMITYSVGKDNYYFIIQCHLL